MKPVVPFLASALLCQGGNAKAILNSEARLPLAAPIAVQSVTGTPVRSTLARELAASIDVRDYGIAADGRTDDRKAMSALLTTIGSSQFGQNALVEEFIIS
jgi:hypothetical protein